MNNPKRPRGRPPIGDKPMKLVHIRLDERTIERAKAIGNGNLSEGLRHSVSLVAAAKGLLPESPDTQQPG